MMNLYTLMGCTLQALTTCQAEYPKMIINTSAAQPEPQCSIERSLLLCRESKMESMTGKDLNDT
jgi:hypothetical protein